MLKTRRLLCYLAVGILVVILLSVLYIKQIGGTEQNISLFEEKSSLKIKRKTPIKIDLNKFAEFGALRYTADGGYIIAGSTDPYKGNNGDIFLIKTDSEGRLLWQKTYGKKDRVEKGYSVVQTEDGGYIVAGWAGLYFCVVKFDVDGNFEWEKTFVDGVGCEVQNTSDGQYVVTGWGKKDSSFDNNIYTVKIDRNGNSVWESFVSFLRAKPGVGEQEDSFGYSIQQTSDRGYVIIGNGAESMCLVKLDPQGCVIWKELIEETDNDDTACFVRETADGGYLILGELAEYSQECSEEIESSDVVLVRTDANGHIIWRNVIDKGKYDVPILLELTRNDKYIVLYTSSASPEQEGDKSTIYLSQIDDSGSIIEETAENSENGEQLWFAQRIPNGNIATLMTRKNVIYLAEIEPKWSPLTNIKTLFANIRTFSAKTKNAALEWVDVTFNKSSPERTVIEYFQAMERLDVDKLCELTASETLFKEMLSLGINSFDEYKEAYRETLLEVVPQIEESEGKNWSEMLVTEVVAQTDTRARVKCTIGKSSDENPLYIDLVKEDGKWKVLAE